MDSENSTKNQGKNDSLATGVVVESLPNATFRVELENEKIVFAYLSGKMRLHRIKVLVGDKVEVLLDQYEEKGRITRRF